MTLASTSRRGLPAALAVAIGAAMLPWAPPAMAQVRAAMVQSVDEPGRNPYQETQFNTTCRTTTVCTFDFAVVPAGKRLVLTGISGYVDTGAGTLPNGFVMSGFGGPGYATLAFPGVRGPTGALGTRSFINQTVLAFFGPGEPVRGEYHVNGTGDVMSGGALMMLTGYFINLP